MDLEKRKIIVNEIEKWRKSKLLPEHYCVFLLNLYTDSAANSTETESKVGFTTNVNWNIWIYIIIGGLAITFTVLYFNVMPLYLQILACITFFTFCCYFGYRNQNHYILFSYMGYGTGAIFILLAGIYLLQLHHADIPNHISLLLGFCSAVWLFIGLLTRMSLFHLCGWIGFLMLYAWLLYNFSTLMWYELQFSWLPISCLFIWIGWVVHHKYKSEGIVLLMIGSLLWFMPEIFTAVFETDPTLLQALLAFKLATAAIASLLLRRKWQQRTV